jgi:hypothetical protein
MGNVSRKLSKRYTYRQTTPQGAEIPIPKRKDVLGDLRRVAKANDRPVRPKASEKRDHKG